MFENINEIKGMKLVENNRFNLRLFLIMNVEVKAEKTGENIIFDNYGNSMKLIVIQFLDGWGKEAFFKNFFQK